jgi:hypothetical protein
VNVVKNRYRGLPSGLVSVKSGFSPIKASTKPINAPINNIIINTVALSIIFPISSIVSNSTSNILKSKYIGLITSVISFQYIAEILDVIRINMEI